MLIVPLLLALAQSPAEAALPVQPHPLIARTPGAADVPGLPVTLAPGALGRRATSARFAGPPIADLAGRVLAVERVPLPIAADARLVFDGADAGRPGEGLAIELWRGHVEGEPASDVFLALSPSGSRGWVRTTAGTTHLLAERDEAGRWNRARWMAASGVGSAAPFACDALPLSASGRPHAPALPPSGGGALDALASQPLFGLRMAIETDHALYELFGDLAAAEAYTIALLGAVASTYRAEVGVVLETSYLAFYSTPFDPWNSPEYGGTADLLFEMQALWNDDGPHGADLNHVLSGAPLGGGIAYLDVLCTAEYAYAVSANLGGDLPFPAVQGPLTWDFVVFAHELGHNFSSPHTHDYCPPLDQCAPDGYWGWCQGTSDCQEGTLMGYCHLCEGGMENVLLTFHPTVRAKMREAVEAGCLAPYADLATEQLGGEFAFKGPAMELGAALDAIARELRFTYDHAPAPTAAWLVLGSGELGLPLAGGTVVPAPDILVPFLPAASSGTIGPFPLASGFPLGLVLHAQAWAVDLVSPGSLGASNALRLELHLPPPPPALTWVQHPSNGLEYARTPALTWPAAEKLAAQYGAHLAALDTAVVQAWLKTNFIDGGPGGPHYIGYTDRYSEGEFRWVSGATGTHTAWAANEPNDWGGFEDYTMWPWDGDGWNDGHGLDEYPALIQRPVR